ncbi:hypothetical protein BHE74_00021015 [Ensete ventricosum]|nr:hypothetical protein BHE74_00021015 [Ensete ventricosum]
MAGWHQAQGFRFRRSRFPPQAISGKGGREEGKSKRETNSRKLREGDRRGTAILWSTRFDGHPCPRHSVWRKRKKRTPPSGRQCASRVRIRGQQRELTEISKCRVGFASSHVRYDATCRHSHLWNLTSQASEPIREEQTLSTHTRNRLPFRSMAQMRLCFPEVNARLRRDEQ